MNAPLDKQAHFLAGACIAFAFGAFGFIFVGVLAAILAGLAKEMYDDQHRSTHTVEAWDTGATMFGGFVAGAVTWIGDYVR